MEPDLFATPPRTRDYQALMGRLEKLETQNLRLKRVGFAILVLGGIALLMGQAKPGQIAQLVEAERFVLRDANGKTRADLGFEEGAPSLALFDGQGSRRVSIS